MSKKFHLKDSDLRKVCTRMQIPLPKSGYWQKIRSGKSVPKPSLLSDYKGESEIQIILNGEGSIFSSENLSPLVKLQKEIEQDYKDFLKIPLRLTDPDKLIAVAKANLERQTKSHYSDLVSTSSNLLRISVSKENASRALRFMDALIKLLRARGHDVLNEFNSTYALIEGERIEISLREKQTKIIEKGKPYDTTRYMRSGILVFKMDRVFAKEWYDDKRLIEEKLSNIIARLELKGEEGRERRLHWAKVEEERRNKEAILKEFEIRQEKELQVFKKFLSDANRWHQCRKLRDYLNEVKHSFEYRVGSSEEMSNWIAWAQRKIDWYDPLIEANDELLDEIDKETLTVRKKSFY